MEMRDLIKEYGIIGVISSYEIKKDKGKIKDIEIRDLENALRMVGLNYEEYKDKNIKDLSLSEIWLVDLAKKLDNDIIIVGNMSSYLNKKVQEYINKLFIKLNKRYNKKVIIIDNNAEVFLNLVNYICVINNDEIIYGTENIYDDELYKYVSMPKIVEFTKYVNKDKKILKENTDILELIKEIFRSI